MSLQGSPNSATSRSQNESPRSSRSSSPVRSPRQQSRSRSATPENISHHSRSRSGSPTSQRSRTASSHSSVGDAAVQERKDIEDSGSEDEPKMDVVVQETDEPMNSANESPRESPTPARKMSVESVNSQGSNMGSPNGPKQQDSPKGTKTEFDDKDEISNNGAKEDAVGAEDIFGDDLSISSEDEDDKSAKRNVIDDDEDSNQDEHRVQRYGDDHPEAIEGESGSASVSPKGRGREKSHSRSRSRSPARYDDERKEDEDMEKEPEKAPETVSIHVEVPKITTNLGKELYFVKLPNFLSVDCKPFDPETYEDEIEDEENPDEEGRERLKLKVENTIRWRQSFDSEGKAYKESNARMVRWSDGSSSLHLGNEIFDVHKQPLAGDYNHMFIRQGTGLQGQAIFRNKLSFRPHSTESFTHQKMTRQMADRTNRGGGIKVISQVGNDPEIGRYKRVKEEEERLRADLRRDSMVNRKKERATGRNLSKGYLEGGDSDEDGVSLAQIKSKYKKGAGSKVPDYVRPGYSTEEEDSDVETKKARRLEKAKAALRDSEESDHSEAASKDSKKSRSRSQSRESNESVKSRPTSRSPVGSGRSRSASRSISKSKSRSRSRSGSGSPVTKSRSPKSGSRTPSKSGSESD